MRMLDHPCIPTAYEFYRGERDSALVMDYAVGRSLDEFIMDRETTFDAADVALIARQLLATLAYIHAQGVRHGDLAADNVLFDTSTRTVMLIDWNVAAVIPSESTTDETPRDPRALPLPREDELTPYGKPAYREADGMCGTGFQKDMFACGVLLKMLCSDVGPELGAILSKLQAPLEERYTAAEAVKVVKSLAVGCIVSA